MTLQWSEKLTTGVAEVDEQHRSLFDLFTQLEDAAADQRTMTATYALTRLSQYTRSHFLAEEKLMADHAYPRLNAHRAEHDAFRIRLGEIQTLAITNDISEETMVFLREWLIRHIMVSDMDYVPYVRGLSATVGGPAH